MLYLSCHILTHRRGLHREGPQEARIIGATSEAANYNDHQGQEIYTGILLPSDL
jgi:hypothetical protein